MKLHMRTLMEIEVGDAIAIVWRVHDVIDGTRDEDDRPTLTRMDARNVLRRVFAHHDATLGITWDSIAYEAERLYGPLKAVPGSAPNSYPGCEPRTLATA